MMLSLLARRMPPAQMWDVAYLAFGCCHVDAWPTELRMHVTLPDQARPQLALGGLPGSSNGFHCLTCSHGMALYMMVAE
jgi:hypothetical protein